MQRGCFITITDLQLLYGCSYRTAWRKMKKLRREFNKNDIVIEEFCESISLPEKMFHKYTNPHYNITGQLRTL